MYYVWSMACALPSISSGLKPIVQLRVGTICQPKVMTRHLSKFFHDCRIALPKSLRVPLILAKARISIYVDEILSATSLYKNRVEYSFTYLPEEGTLFVDVRPLNKLFDAVSVAFHLESGPSLTGRVAIEPSIA